MLRTEARPAPTLQAATVALTAPTAAPAATAKKPVLCNEEVVRGMLTLDFCALCEAMASSDAPVLTLEMLYAECVRRKIDVDALIVEQKRRERQKLPYADYTKYISPLMQAMASLNAASTQQGVRLVRNAPHARFTISDCLALLHEAAELLSCCESDDTEAQEWLEQWGMLQRKKGFPTTKKEVSHAPNAPEASEATTPA